MLPSFWHGMEPSERRVVMTIMQSHNFEYTAASLKLLHEECMLPFSQINDILVCIIISRLHPETLDMSVVHQPSHEDAVESVSKARAAAAK